MTSSPNHDERRGPIDILLLHYTGMTDAEEALARLCSRHARVSSHYFVFEDGRVVQLVDEARRAWHAGLSFWKGERDINSRSVGIEIANPGHDWGYRPFPEAQIEAVIALSREIVGRHPIPPERVLAHSDVAPARKQDPGELFPWDRLAAAGVGHWTEPAPLGLDDTVPVDAIGVGLAAYGYGIAGVTGEGDALLSEAVAAFQRHFRPARVDGVADLSTLRTLEALLSKL